MLPSYRWPLMICHEKSALQDKYQKEVRAYSDAILKMRQYGVSGLPLVELELLLDSVARAFDLCKAAYRSLQSHIAEHHC